MRDYLDELVSAAEIERKARRFVDLLCSRKDEWTQLDPPQGRSRAAFEAASTIRNFIRTEFSQLTNATIEDLLMKFYSGDKDAVVPTLPPSRTPTATSPWRSQPRPWSSS